MTGAGDDGDAPAQNVRKSASARQAAPERIGERIKQVRELRGLSLSELGRGLPTPRSKAVVWEWERAETAITFPKLLDLATALRCSVYYLCAGLGTPDVVSSPLKVATSQGVPVPLMDENLTAPQTVTGFVMARDGDEARTVMDKSMEPFWQEIDVVLYRPGKAPKPGKFVWARNRHTGEVMLRKYRAVKDPRRPGVSYELVPFSEDYVAVDGGEHIEILGGVMETTRIHDLD